jgi:F-type H+-transporting ATPase subunit b
MNINATLLVQALSFAALIWFTVSFVWPMLTDAIDDRNKRIADGLAAAEKGRQALELSAHQVEEALKEARARAAEILAQADKRATEMIEQAKNQARDEGSREKTAARAEIEQEYARAREQLREHVAALAVAGAEKILRREVDAKAHSELLAAIRQQI